MPRLHTRLLTAGLLTASTLLLNPWLCLAQEAAGRADASPRFMPADALAYARVAVGKLTSDPAFELYPTEVLSAVGMEQLGFDPLLIESVDLAVGMPSFAGPAFGAIVRLREAVAVEDLSPQVLKGEAYEEAGRTFHPTASPLMDLHQVDEQTYLVGTSAYLQAMLAEGHGDSKLKSLVRAAAAQEPAFFLAIDLEPLRPLLQGALEQVKPDIPPELYPHLETLASSIDRLALMQTIGENAAIQLALVQANPQKAQAVAHSLRELLEIASRMALELARSEPADSPAIAEAAVAYAERIGGYVKRQLAPRQSGNNVAVQYRTDGNMMSLGTAGVLTGLLLPAVQQAREAARRINSQNNFRQVGLAVMLHQEQHGSMPADIVDKATGEPLLSWRVAILPFIEHQDLYDRFHLDEPWDSPHNLPLVDAMPEVYKHPSSPSHHRTRLAMPNGQGVGVAGLEPSRITDGLRNTIIALELPESLSVPWSAPGDIEIDLDAPLAEFESMSPGFVTVFGDGSVRPIDAREITAETFRSVLTPAAND